MTKSRQVNIADAKARLPELVERAAQGEEVVIARHGRPRARLVPLAPRMARTPGAGAGKWELPEDFNAPLPPEVQDAFDSGTS